LKCQRERSAQKEQEERNEKHTDGAMSKDTENNGGSKWPKMEQAEQVNTKQYPIITQSMK
jgi:hypothetical protein